MSRIIYVSELRCLISVQFYIYGQYRINHSNFYAKNKNILLSEKLPDLLLLLSDSESGSESALSSLEDEDDDDEDDAELELSELKPVGFWRSTLSARAATSGRNFCTQKRRHFVKN